MMTGDRPSVEPLRRYTQSQAARALGVHPSTLRRWELEGKCRFGRVRATGAKFVTGGEILRLWSAVF